MTRQEIKPEFDKIQKYFKDIRSIPKGAEGYERIKIRDLLNDYNIAEHIENMCVIGYWYSELWKTLNKRQRNKPDPINKHNSELADLNAFLENNKCTGIVFTTNNPEAYREGKDKTKVTISNQTLINKILHRIAPEGDYIEALGREARLSVGFRHTDLPREDSHHARFKENLSPLYKYLLGETSFTTNTEAYEFIEDFCKVLTPYLQGQELSLDLHKYIK